MTRAHVEYGKLCVLAAAGELSAEDAGDLDNHAASCLSCQRRLAETSTASWAVFLHHASKAKGAHLPAGMQQRFAARAAGVGIPLRDTTLALPGTHVLGLALSAVLLMVSTQVGRKLHSMRAVERAFPLTESTPGRAFQEISAPSGPAVVDALLQRPIEKRIKGTADAKRPRDAGSRASSQRATGKAHSQSVQYESASLRHDPPTAFFGSSPLFASAGNRASASSGLRLPTRRIFRLSSVPALFAENPRVRPDQHAFRYSPTLVSLTFLGSPERVVWPRLPAMSEPPPFRPQQ